MTRSSAWPGGDAAAKFTRRAFAGGAVAAGAIGSAVLLHQERKTAMQAVNPEGVQIPGISQAMRVESGALLFLSGHVPLLPDGSVAGPDLRVQLRQVFINMQATLTAAGSDFSHVARLTLYVRDYDPTELEAIRQVRDAFVNAEKPPASALIGVASLFHPEVRVEVDAVAAVG